MLRTSKRAVKTAAPVELGVCGAPVVPAGRHSAYRDTRVIYCGDLWEQLSKLPEWCVDLFYVHPLFNSKRSNEVIRGGESDPRAQASGSFAHFEDHHTSTQTTIEFMPLRSVGLARVPKKTGSFYDHCDWHASHFER